MHCNTVKRYMYACVHVTCCLFSPGTFIRRNCYKLSEQWFGRQMSPGKCTEWN